MSITGETLNDKINNILGNMNETLKNNNIVNLGNNNVVQDNFFMISIIFSVLLIFMIVYFCSKTFRVWRTMDKINMYIRYQNLSSLTPYIVSDYKLCDFYIASSFNTGLCGYQKFDYISTDIIRKVLQGGARYIEFSVFSSGYGNESIPIVSSGYRTGEWKMTINTISFESCMKTVAENAFTFLSGDKGVRNNEDPLIISLDIKTNNLFVLDKMEKILTDYFQSRYLPNKYGYQKSNLGELKMKDIFGKIIIISSEGYKGSRLEEIINYSWDMDKLNRIHHSDFEKQDTLDVTHLKKFNNQYLSIVVPHREGDFWTDNYSPHKSWESGCQFVSMNYQRLDGHMDEYITKFRSHSFVLKPSELIATGRQKVSAKSYASMVDQQFGYEKHSGKVCSGRNEGGIINNVSLNKCKNNCTDDPKCVSFEYGHSKGKKHRRCTKSYTCDGQAKKTSSNNYNLYIKK